MNSIPSFTDVDLGLSRVAVVAPAGFGKTETIADIVGRADRRVLVLTHTNAGVAALQRRMATKGTAANGCVMTIASWCERWVSSFPETSGYAEFASDETGRNKADDYYLKVYKAMEKLTGHGWVRKSLFSSYSRVIVDEYQDCTQSQHSLFLAISTFLPVLVFGDPLQGIFYWVKDDSIVDWGDLSMEVRVLKGRPHRWENCGHPELGSYILAARKILIPALHGEPVIFDLGMNCRDVKLISKDAFNRMNNWRAWETVAFITGPPRVQHAYARKHREFCSAEPVDNLDSLEFLAGCDELVGVELASSIIGFMANCCTGIAGEMKSYISRLKSGNFDFSHIRKNQLTGQALMRLEHENSPAACLNVIDTMEVELRSSIRIHRRLLLREAKSALRIAARESLSATDSLEKLRTSYASKDAGRFMRQVSTRTTLAKGLEYDCAIVDAETIKDPRDFYVAISRCCRHLILVSDNRYLHFKPVATL